MGSGPLAVGDGDDIVLGRAPAHWAVSTTAMHGAHPRATGAKGQEWLEGLHELQLHSSMYMESDWAIRRNVFPLARAPHHREDSP